MNKLNTPQARWAALVQDNIVPMPRFNVTGLIIREQAGVPADRMLVRDRQSPEDDHIFDDTPVDLRQGNVFRVVARCESPPPCANVSDPKLAVFLDDKFEIILRPEQTEGSLRRLFDLHPKVQLLRDLESPNDQPIADGETVHFADGPVFLSCVEIEHHCSGEEGPPDARRYIIRVGDKRIVVDKPKIKGREILSLAGFDPAMTLLNQRIGKRFEPVGLDQIVDLTVCGIERFTTLPNEQGEGRPYRDFALPEGDAETLDASGLNWETVTEGGVNWLIVKGIRLPDTFVQEPTDVAYQIPSGYPTTGLDMAFFSPAVRRLDGRAIARTEATQPIRGCNWQRWSRHYTAANPWKPGDYSVMTHYLLCLAWLERESKKA